MPTKNTIKTYVKNAHYHIYNRGVDKREIFIDQKDCSFFLYLLKTYLSPKEILLQQQLLPLKMVYKITNLNIAEELDLLSFSLMPNHFHLQVKQYQSHAIEKLCRRVLTSYAQFFNKKYNRVGTLFESTYKAVILQTEEQYLYLSSYIHRNPMKLKNPKFDFVQFSSYPYYLGSKRAPWLKPDEILSFFNTSKKGNELLSYKSFVESFKEEPKDVLQNLVMEDDY